MHKDVVDNQWGAHVQRRVKRIEADAPDEGDTSGIYRFTTEPHPEEDCPFQGIDTIPMVYEQFPDGWALPEGREGLNE